jgi:TolB-like protein/lipoprotein NlpI
LASLIQRLTQRKIVQWAIAYVAGAWLLVEVLSFIAENFGWPAGIVRGAAVFLGIGFFVALVLAWYHGEKGQQRVTRLELSIIAGLLLSASVAVAYVSRGSAPQEPETGAQPTLTIDPRAIAVLPFADMSAEGDQEYFSDGIAEELLSLLGKIPGLLVAARTSSFSFKGQNLEIPEIAERLHVAHVLEGSVRKAGNEVRITAQLIRAADGFHVWADTWDRSLDDIFAIQDEIAADVVAQLKVTLLGGAPKVEQTDPEAYALFLQARQLGRQFTAEGFEQSIALYERALEIDSDYAAAWAGLSNNYGNQTSFGLRPIDEGYRLAREAANRALAIDSEYAPAHALLGRVAMSHEGDLAAAARHYERALRLASTDADVLRSAASLAKNLGRLDDAFALQEYAVARDPLNPNANAGLGFTYLDSGRLDDAIASFRTALSLSPGSIAVQSGIGLALLRKGKPEAALAAMQQESYEPLRLIGLAVAYHALGQAAESDAALAELIEKYEQEAAVNIAYVLAFRGEADRAFEWLDKAMEYEDPGLALIAVETLFANIHDDPRWLPFLESIGKSPEQLAAIEFNVTLPK